MTISQSLPRSYCCRLVGYGISTTVPKKAVASNSATILSRTTWIYRYSTKGQSLIGIINSNGILTALLLLLLSAHGFCAHLNWASAYLSRKSAAAIHLTWPGAIRWVCIGWGGRLSPINVWILVGYCMRPPQRHRVTRHRQFCRL